MYDGSVINKTRKKIYYETIENFMFNNLVWSVFVETNYTYWNFNWIYINCAFTFSGMHSLNLKIHIDSAKGNVFSLTVVDFDIYH